MIEARQIKPDMSIVCSNDGQLGFVDHMEGKDTIKLKKDSKGQHHFIPLSWVKTVDSQIHCDRPGAQAMKEWSMEAPLAGSASSSKDGASHSKDGTHSSAMSADKSASSSNHGTASHAKDGASHSTDGKHGASASADKASSSSDGHAKDASSDSKHPAAANVAKASSTSGNSHSTKH